MLIRHDLKLIFIHVPKCGGTKLRSVLKKGCNKEDISELWNYAYDKELCRYVDKAHMPMSDLRGTKYEEFIYKYNVIACCRNPYLRLYSAANEFYRQKGKDTEAIIKDCGTTIEMRRKYYKRLGRMHSSLDPRYIHSLPITRFTHIGERPVIDYILRCENMRADFKDMSDKLKLPKMIKKQGEEVLIDSNEENLLNKLQDEELRIAERIYESDFKTFEYEMDKERSKLIKYKKAESVKNIHLEQGLIWHWGPEASKGISDKYIKTRGNG